MNVRVFSNLIKKGAIPALTLMVLLFLPAGIVVKADVPTISISLEDTTLDEINNGDKSARYAGNKATIVDIQSKSIQIQENVEIKGRGNTTWKARKKPYQIKFEQKTDLFGLGKAKKWVLLANYFDASQLRNDLALSIARSIGLPGTTGGVFVELFIDDEDLGLYYLCHKPEISDSVLNLKTEEGVLFEIDQPGDEDEISFMTPDGDHFNLKDSVSGDPDVIKKAAGDFETKWNRFVADAKVRNWEAVSSQIDVDSFCKYYLLNELGMNLDATLTSFYVYMDGPSDVIHAGPPWDFDMCFGNQWGKLTERMWAYQSLHNEPDPNSHILMTLLDIPEFRHRAEEIWRDEMRSKVEECIGEMETKAVSIRTEAIANNNLWELAGYDTAVFSLRTWVLERVDSLSNWFSQPAALEDGNYIISAEGSYLTGMGLSGTALRTKLTKLKDGFWTIGMPDDSSYLTGTARTSQYFSTPSGGARMNINAQEWMIQELENGKYAFFNKDSGLYLRILGGFLQEGKRSEGVTEFDLRSTAEQDVLVESFIKRLYKTLLDREVDKTGLASWSRFLFSGTPAAKVISGITNSPEYLSRSISDTEYVKMLYRALLGREAKDKEIPAWLSVLNQGYTRKKLIEGVSGSDEYVAMCDEYQIVAGKYRSDDILDHNGAYLRFVGRLYVYGLGRKWDDASLRGWMQRIVDGKTSPETVAMIMLDSGEMRLRKLSDKDFIRAVYLSLLNREPDPPGESMWLLALEIGYDRSRMIHKVIKSGEFSV